MEIDNLYTIGTSSSLTVTVTTSAVAYTLPVSQVTLDATSGRSSSPRVVRVLAEGSCYINFHETSTAQGTLATATLITGNSTPEYYMVAGKKYISVIARSTATNICVTPVEY